MVAIVVDGDEFLGLITRIDLLNWLRRRMDRRQTNEVRDQGHPRRPGARPAHRRGDDADLRHLDLRAVEPRRAQGLRLRAHAQPHARRARGVRRRARRRQARLRVRLGHGGDRHRARAARFAARTSSPWTICTAAATGSSSACASALPGSRPLSWISSRPENLEAAHQAEYPHALGREPDQPAAEAGGSRAPSPRSRASAGIISVCDNTFASPWVAAAARARLRHRGALDHQVPERPLRRRSAARPILQGRHAARKSSRSCRTPSAACRARSTPSSRCAASRRSRCAWSATAATRMHIAAFLEKHPKVAARDLPGLASHPQQLLAARQMNGATAAW